MYFSEMYLSKWVRDRPFLIFEVAWNGRKTFHPTVKFKSACMNILLKEIALRNCDIILSYFTILLVPLRCRPSQSIVMISVAMSTKCEPYVTPMPLPILIINHGPLSWSSIALSSSFTSNISIFNLLNFSINSCYLYMLNTYFPLQS